jgi:phosphatidyl-myo-inositol alpha-mannosyltransferase
MRVALVSPYSWTYPGGVTRHIEALATELSAAGHDVRVLAPFDDDVRRTAIRHRGARPQARPRPDRLISLGPTIGWPLNGAVSNLAHTPYAISTLRRELRAGRFDVVHLHEPVAPVVGWDAMTSTDAPLVGTFHCYSESRLPHHVAALMGARRKMNHFAVRIAVSEAAAWTGRRFYGGRYRVIPNGVVLPPDGAPAPRVRAPGEPLRIAFVGQAVERKGLPVLLRAFEALRRQVPAELRVVGVEEGEIAPLLLDGEGVHALGRVGDDAKRELLERSDVLCAPSLGGESFGMVLTEAFAAGTPVVASDIAGYRDVVADGVDGLLVPRGDATRLAESLRDLALDPARTARLGAAAGGSAERYAWPRVAAEVAEAYEAAVAVPAPVGAVRRAGVRVGALPADGEARAPARRLRTLEPPPPAVTNRPAFRIARRAVLAASAVGAGVGTLLALERIGLRPIGQALVTSSPTWVLVALALMCASMLMRAISWHAILRAALPEALPRFVDAMQGTTIGVLMSATLPARLGEPSRALIVARRLGRARERLPVVLGTLVSQTLMNVLALVILGAVMFTTIGLFAGRQQALIWYALAPFGVLIAVLVAPALLRSGPSRSARMARWMAQARGAAARVRTGLVVFRRPRLGAAATGAQLGAWALQLIACYVLLVALHLDGVADLGAAAAVLFAVNVTAVLPVTPSNLGVFQAACVAVLTGAYGIHAAEALGYGIILQAVEVATAVVMGAPALVKEGVSWREVRLRALHTAPVSLGAAPAADAISHP